MKVAAAQPPLLLDMVAGAATSSRIAPNVRAEIDWYDISSQKSDGNADPKMWQQNLLGNTMPEIRQGAAKRCATPTRSYSIRLCVVPPSVVRRIPLP